MLTKTAALHSSRTTGRRDSALHVLTQPFTADKVSSYVRRQMLQPMALDRWSQVTIHAKPTCCSIGLPHAGAYHVCKSCLRIPRIDVGKRSSCG
jgi:hypothetical protein